VDTGRHSGRTGVGADDEPVTTTVDARPAAQRRNLGSWAGYAAALWSFCYGMLGLYWWSGGAGYPFAPVDEDHRSGSILEGTDASAVAPFMAVLGLAGAAVAVYMARSTRTRRGAYVVAGFGWVMAAGLALVLPDYSLLAFLAFAPLLVVFAFTGVPGPQDGIGDIMYWHRNNLLILFAGGLLWAWATLVYQRRIRQACVRCGRAEDDEAGKGRERWLRLGHRCRTRSRGSAGSSAYRWAFRATSWS
jgi:hypothetical protein